MPFGSRRPVGSPGHIDIKARFISQPTLSSAL